MILIIDYGSQYTQLIARRVREQNVYSQIVPYYATLEAFRSDVKGVILSGGPASVYEEKAPTLPAEVLGFNVPILGICYGAQLLVHAQGGKVTMAQAREFGRADIRVVKKGDLFEGMAEKENSFPVWMSHGDRIETLSPNFEVLATSDNSPFAAIQDSMRRYYGLLFHPEVTHTPIGRDLIGNFLFRICKVKPDWTMEQFIAREIDRVRAKVGKDHVICGLSGGVDSSVVTLLLHKAIGKQLTAVFVDTGLLRYQEAEEVEKNFRDHFHVDLRVIDASARFFEALKDKEEPEEKRKIIGKLFVDVFEEEARRISGAKFLAQGTLYPDVIESAAHKGPSTTIKTHHNVGGLPEKMNLTLIEPVRELFKDEVREVGRELGLDQRFVSRHPFPGPGLAVRILGAITPERVELLQKADKVFIDELRSAGLYDSVWQAFAVLLPVRSVGVMGDFRTYENVCALRAVVSLDGMTADWAELPHDFLGRVSNRIINEVRGINRVVYDISSKPPATIEWE